MKTENRFSPGPADQRNQATLRHPERSTYRCFLTDLAGFTDICRVGPDYADRQDRKKTGLFHLIISFLQYPKNGSNNKDLLSQAEHHHFTTPGEKCQAKYLPIRHLEISLRWEHLGKRTCAHQVGD